MTIFTSIVGVKGRQAYDGALKLLAKWDPETVGEAQISEWANQAADMARIAAKAATDAKAARDVLATLQNNVNRYSSAAEKLMATNEAAANQAADQALEYRSQLSEAKEVSVDADAWETESREAAERAERLLLEGRQKIEKSKRDQERALQESQREERRRADRERAAGITKGLSSADAAIDAMAANTRELKEKAAANRIRNGVLDKTIGDNAAINAALNEVDGTVKPITLQEKLAALKN